MNERDKAALSIGGLSVFGAHTILEDSVDNRVQQAVSGSVSASSFYIGDILMDQLGVKSKSPIRRVIGLGIAVTGAYLGYSIGQKIVEKYKLNKDKK